MMVSRVLVLVVVLVAGLLVVPSRVGVFAEGSGLCDVGLVEQFSDVGSGDYGAEYILCMRVLGLSVGRGDGSFGSDLELTRGQMASFLVRLWRDVLGEGCPSGVDVPFVDVAGNTHEANIGCLFGLGITKGTTAVTYGPGERLKGSQISRFLLRVYEKLGGWCDGSDDELQRALTCLVGLGVVPSEGEGGSSAPVVRAQMAVYMIGLWYSIVNESSSPVPPSWSGGSLWVDIDAGRYHSCGVRVGGEVVCWGWNGSGQTDSPSGVFVSVSAGFDHSCGLREDGAGVCWGADPDGDAAVPEGLFRLIVAGGEGSCGIQSEGSVACWVWNDASTVQVTSGEWADLAAGARFPCGVTAGGDVKCGGDSFYGQHDVPPGRYVDVDVYWHVCGIREDGAAVCWGYSEAGVLEAPSGRFVAVAAGGGHACGIREGGAGVCWGANDHGQTDVPSGRYTAITAGKAHSCGIRTDRTAVCWGFDYSGQLDVP